jgi:NAD(P)-dependent dehydrogenase (short-subunit alcohol dehydrogenase family)
MNFEGQTIIVTGGTSGIGRAVVDLLAKRGAQVALIARNPEKGRAVVEATGADLFEADIQDETAMVEAFRAIDDYYERIDGLVANAGIALPEGLLHTVPSHTWDRIEGVDLRGTYLTVREALTRMVRQGAGSIVCISSVVAHSAIPGAGSAYAAAKGAIEAFVRSVAVDYGGFGVRCNAVAPGATETPMMWVNVPSEEIPEVRSTLEMAVPLGRLAEPIDISQGIVWLLSNEAAYITGATLIIDGGVTARSVLPA